MSSHSNNDPVMNAVITGASSGIGRALARTFARHGHAVLAVARREERLLALSQEMAEQHNPAHRNGTIHPLSLDITKPDAAQTILDEAVHHFGRAHILINVAGMSPYQKFQEMEYEHLRQTMRLNVKALTELCYLFLGHMQAHGQPSHLVNVGSVGGYAPLPNFSVYTASKHYVRALTNCLYREYQGTNIRVSALHPGGTLTEFPPLAGQGLKPSAMRAMMTPEQVAEKAYPAILNGKRVIIPGFIDKVAIVIGKFLPFPMSIRVMEYIYNQNVEKTTPTYPL